MRDLIIPVYNLMFSFTQLQEFTRCRIIMTHQPDKNYIMVNVRLVAKSFLLKDLDLENIGAP